MSPARDHRAYAELVRKASINESGDMAMENGVMGKLIGPIRSPITARGPLRNTPSKPWYCPVRQFKRITNAAAPVTTVGNSIRILERREPH